MTDSQKKCRELQQTLEVVQIELLSSEKYPSERKEAINEVVTMVKKEIGTIFSHAQKQILEQKPHQQQPQQPVPKIELTGVLKEVVKDLKAQKQEMEGVSGMMVDHQDEIESLKERLRVAEEMIAKLATKVS